MDRRQAIYRALLGAGFEEEYDSQYGSRFLGTLECFGEKYPIRLKVPDLDLVRHPIIELTPRPADLPAVCGHVGLRGDICYSTPSRDVLDYYGPGASVLACVKAAQDTLCRALRGETAGDTREDFHAYWRGILAFMCDVPLSAPDGWANLFELSRTSDPDRLIRLASNDVSVWESLFEAKSIGRSVYLATGKTLPGAGVSDKWPPSTLGDLVDWLREIESGRLYKALQTAIQEHFEYSSEGFALLVRTPGAWWAAQVHLDKERLNVFRKSGRSEKTAQRWAKFARNHGREWAVTRYLVERADAAHLVERNLGGRSGFAGKRILVIGAGTIGGFFVDLLARAGAGSSGGSLKVFDTDTLLPGNIGRHYLGMEDLYRPKAVAVADRVKRSLPHIQVEGVLKDGRTADLALFDLVVDATGSEAFSLVLNERVVRRGHTPSTLFVWNEGAGVAAQCLLVNSHKHACFRCLSDEHRRPRFSPHKESLDGDPFVMGIGCDTAYVPYPASVSMQAAAMAAGLAQDWADGRLGHRLRTVLIDPARGRQVKNTTAAPHSRCPACS